MTLRLWAVLAVAGGLAVATVSGCSNQNENAIKITGSDTMVNLAQAWAESFHGDHPEISLQVNGGGSGVGIASLCDGKIDIATASRQMKPKEIELAEANTGKPSPRSSSSAATRWRSTSTRTTRSSRSRCDELAEIYGEGGKITTLVATGRRQPGLHRRRDHPRQPAEQLGHLCLFPRGRAGQEARVQARAHVAKRLDRRRGPGFEHPLRHRLQRHGLQRPTT